jgi:processive 1,2-diacylglycerol beta-glucosyltransferase
MRGMLERRDIMNVIVSGIPLDPVFYQEKNKLELRKTYGIPEKQKTFVAISGGQGLTALERIIKELFSAKEPTTIIAIAGDNKILENRLKKLEPPKHIKLIILGWTNKIDDYLRLADVVISKPGGVTTTECVTLGVPMLAVQPLPGQEEENIEYLLENRYGVVARNPEDLLFYISEKPEAIAPGLQNKAPAKASAEIILQTLLAS